MRLISTLVAASGAKRMLEVGCGLGYSALWLARSGGPSSRVETIDRFGEHVDLARRYATEAGLADQLDVIEGEGADVLQTLAGPYDLVHDDGWFAEEPPYLERMIDLLRPDGLMIQSNWFLLRESFAEERSMDWSAFAGAEWPQQIQAYARKLASHPQLSVSFIADPGLAVAVKLK